MTGVSAGQEGGKVYFSLYKSPAAAINI